MAILLNLVKKKIIYNYCRIFASSRIQHRKWPLKERKLPSKSDYDELVSGVNNFVVMPTLNSLR